MKFCLGTVQLGLYYGINSQLKKQPTSNDGCQILHTACENGINYLDTASAYGTAEKLIGESGVLDNGDMHVITKIDAKVHSGFVDEITKSLIRLKQKRIDGVLLHDASNYYDNLQVTELLNLKEKGLVNYIGVSVYEPIDALQIARDGIVDYIQVPYNVFDQRLDNSDFFQLTRKNNIKVFARSPFLQGLILMNPNKVPEKLKSARTYIEKYREIIHEYKFSVAEAAMLFSYTHNAIDKIVFGVDTVSQLKDNLSIINRIDEFEECRQALVGVTSGISEYILNPGLWEV